MGDRLTRSIVVLNETKGDESQTTAETAGFMWKAELINRWFRAYRQTLPAGTSAEPHRHQVPAVLVQTSVGRGLATGAARFELNEAGQWAFFDAGDTHDIRNTGNVPLEVVEVELRQPRLRP
jgi:mannose-6-phosphate isomerase-like protein (cupin superfamily)